MQIKQYAFMFISPHQWKSATGEQSITQNSERTLSGIQALVI